MKYALVSYSPTSFDAGVHVSGTETRSCQVLLATVDFRNIDDKRKGVGVLERKGV